MAIDLATFCKTIFTKNKYLSKVIELHQAWKFIFFQDDIIKNSAIPYEITNYILYIVIEESSYFYILEQSSIIIYNVNCYFGDIIIKNIKLRSKL